MNAKARWKALLTSRTFWVALAAALVPIVNAMLGRALDAVEVGAVMASLAAVIGKLLADDAGDRKAYLMDALTRASNATVAALKAEAERVEAK